MDRRKFLQAGSAGTVMLEDGTVLVFNAMLDTGLDVSIVQSIGYIIPGLIAYWMHRQGVVETISTMLMAAFLVRLALVLAHGGRLVDLAVG